MATHVYVKLVDLSGEAPINECVIDHDNLVHRQWLGRMTFWAFRNNRKVMTRPTHLPITFVEMGGTNNHRSRQDDEIWVHEGIV